MYRAVPLVSDCEVFELIHDEVENLEVAATLGYERNRVPFG